MNADALIPAAVAQVLRHMLGRVVSQPPVSGFFVGPVTVTGAGAPEADGTVLRVLLQRVDVRNDQQRFPQPGAGRNPAKTWTFSFAVVVAGRGAFDRELLAGAVIDAVMQQPVLDQLLPEALDLVPDLLLAAAFTVSGLAARISGIRLLLAHGGGAADDGNFVIPLDVSAIVQPEPSEGPPVRQR